MKAKLSCYEQLKKEKKMKENFQKSEAASDEAMNESILFDRLLESVLIKRNWESIAQFAFQKYLWTGRGATMMDEVDTCRGDFRHRSFVSRSAGWPNIEVEHHVAVYDPQNEIILVIRRTGGELCCLRIRTPSGHLRPPAAWEDHFRAVYGRVDAFDSICNDPQGEQERHLANDGHPNGEPEIRWVVEDFLRELRDNLEEFHATGLELEVRCLMALNYYYDKAVFLSALTHGILTGLDESGGKRLWKPGPNWAKLEKILLSEDETHAMLERISPDDVIPTLLLRQ